MFKIIKKIIALSAMAVVLFSAGQARGADMRQILSRPDTVIDKIFLNIGLNDRLDMIDYLDAGQKEYLRAILGYPVRVSALEKDHVTFEIKDALNVDFYLLADAADSLIVMVAPIPVGAEDSFIAIYDLHGSQPVQYLKTDYTDWLVKNAFDVYEPATLLAAVPMITSTAEVLPERNVVILRNNATNVPGIDPNIAALYKPSITFQRKGRRFIKVNP